MPTPSPRLAVRAILRDRDRLLLVNAYPAGQSPLMCAPGGGVERGASLPDNLKREVYEETGLRIEVGAPCLVNEFHDPDSSFHQVDIYFQCSLCGSAAIDPAWQDIEAIVSEWRWVTEAELAQVPHKPDSLRAAAFGAEGVPIYDPLEPIVR
jgi:8-oxo-dGTP pyrophosphatase MutT (NUDIX family)